MSLLFSKNNTLSINEQKDILLISLLKNFCKEKHYENFESLCNQLNNIGFINDNIIDILQNKPLITDKYINILEKVIVNPSSDSVTEYVPKPTINLYNEFKILSKLGAGGFGNVYKCINMLDKNTYAVKKIIINMDNNNLQKALREVQSLSKLNHKNIVRYNSCWLGYENDIFDSYEKINNGEDELYFDSLTNNEFEENEFKIINLYVQMELCDLSLEKYLNREINISKSKKIFNQLIDGLEYIHKNNIIHRDIKPKNIFLKENNEDFIIKIGDFGLSKNFNCILPKINSIIVKENITNEIGTTTYASPEQLGSNSYDYRTDIFSLGIILYELFTNFNTQIERYKEIGKIREGCYENINPYIVDLCKQILSNNPVERPSLYEIKLIFNKINF